jgi:hypothetical protein
MSPAPDWLLERILLGEVPPHLARRAEEALRDPHNQARLKELEAQNLTDDLRHCASVETTEILRIAKAQERGEAALKRQRRKRLWGIGIPLASLGLCLAVLPGHQALEVEPVANGSPTTANEASGLPRPSQANPSPSLSAVVPDDDLLPSHSQAQLGGGPQTGSGIDPSPVVASSSGIRSKGEDVTLMVHRRADGRAQRLFHGDTIHSGQMLQLSVQAARPVHVWILSRDASGEVAVHLPESGPRSSAMDSGIHALPHAWELDQSSGYERFWIVWAPESFEVKTLEQTVRSLPKDALQLPLPAGLSQRTFTLPKAIR